MPIQDEQFRPYAAPANIIAVINRARTRNLPETINNDFLRIAGVPEAVWYRVTQALQFLKLVHEDGRPSDTMVALAGATDAQYRELLDNIVREAYRSEFNVIDPSQDPQNKIIDAFRPYQPRSQHSRMVMLFLGLCREAGIPVLDVPRERRMRDQQAKRARPSTKTRGAAVTVGTEARRIFEMPRQQTVSGVLFGVTEEDVGVLNDDEFEEVWSALGKVARARARAKKQAIEEENVTEKSSEEE